MSVDSAALRTVESRTRSLTRVRLDGLRDQFGAHLGATVRDSGAITGTELLSQPALHAALLSTLSGTQAGVLTAVRAGYTAGGALARRTVTAELAEQAHPADPGTGPDPAMLAAITATVTAAFLAAQSDIQSSVRAAFDGVAGTSGAIVAARTLITYQALERAVRRLGVRVTAAATVAVHRGYTDTEAALYGAYQAAHTYLRITKEWQTQSAQPCGFCRALHGQVVGLDEEFDPALGPPNTAPLPVFENLLGPPRHPNCRCRLRYRVDRAGQAIRDQVTAAPPAPQPRLSAGDIRRMPTGQFNAFVAFFATATRKIRTLLRTGRRA